MPTEVDSSELWRGRSILYPRPRLQEPGPPPPRGRETRGGREPMVTIRFVVPLMLAAIAAVPELASTAVYVVQPDGAGDFLTIQAAVDAAVDGDAIELANGTLRGPG